MFAGGSSSEEGSGELTFYSTYAADTPQGKALTWLLDQYARQSAGTKFNRVIIPQNMPQRLQAEATTNSLPDIVLIDNPEFPALDATGKLRDLKDPLNEWGLQDAYIKGAQDVVKAPDGRIGGVFAGTNTLAIFYNKKMFSAAGITRTPTTWAEFKEAGLKLARPGVTGFSFSGINNLCTAWQFNPWQWSAGGSDDNLTDAYNVQALGYITDLVKSGVSSKDVLSQCQDEGMQAFVQGKTAMIENGPWIISTLDAAKGLEWGSFPIPVPKSGDRLVVPLGGEVWTLPTTGDKAREAAALEFLRWSQTPEVLGEFNARLNYVPVMQSLWPQAKQRNPKLGAFIDSLKYARGRTTVLGTKTPKQQLAIVGAVQQCILGQASPQEALQRAQSQLG